MTDTTNKKSDTSNGKAKRQFHPREWWAKHYQAWKVSGLSKKQYCLNNSIKPSSFFNWVAKFEKSPAAHSQDTPVASINFVRADVKPEATSSHVTSLAVGDVRVFFDCGMSASDINQWITALRSSQC